MTAKQLPGAGERAQAQAAARQAREAEALRANLRRRKTQAREREGEATMPTVLRGGGFRLYFYSREPNEPPHVHVDRSGSTAKVWLEPVALASHAGFPARELADVLEIVRDNQQTLLEAWHGFFRA